VQANPSDAFIDSIFSLLYSYLVVVQTPSLFEAQIESIFLKEWL
jgi:hypothetical protein